MGKVRAWLRLVRVAALPTALADVWLGLAVTGWGLFAWRTVGVTLTSLALYAGGMVLNDVRDVAADRRDNPDRPLPSGRIRVGHAAALGGALLVAGLLVARAMHPLTYCVAALLTLLILSYNFLLKNTPLGPLNMGLCRVCNVMLGFSAVAHEPASRVHDSAPGFLVPIFAYVIGVSWFARREHEPGGRVSRAPLHVGLGFAAALALCLARQPLVGWDIPPLGVPWVLVTVVPVGLFVFVMASLLEKGKDARRAVTRALVGIIPLQALVAFACGFAVPAACILALLLPVWLLRRLSHIT